jgi:hypothetical protein
MSQTIRKYWGPHQGRNRLNFNWPIINHDSVVLITAAEFSPTVPVRSTDSWVRHVCC